MRFFSAAPRRASARIAFETRAVAHEREVAAFAAGLALVAARFGFGAFLRRRGLGMGARFGAVLQFLRRREFRLGLALERRSAGDFRARAGGGKGGDVCHPTPSAAGGRASPSRGG